MKENAPSQSRWMQVPGFIIAGGLATATHWMVMGMLVLLAFQPLTATAIGSFVGAIANYVLQRRLAFRQAGAHGPAIVRYVCACLFAWVANLGVFALLHDSFAVQVMIAQVLTTLVVAVLNFAVYQRLVFI